MLLTFVRLLYLLALVALTSCGPPSADPLAFDPATVRVPGADLSDEAFRGAITTALGDERLAAFLAGHPHRVEQVEAADASTARAIVTVVFDHPLDDAEYPLDICAIDTDGQPITGLRWLIDGDDITSVSPRWGADRYCGN